MIADKLISTFEEYMMTRLPIDQFDSKGKDLLQSKFEGFVNNNKPIEFVMLGYPFKSPNHITKTLSNKADKTEQISIERINRFTNEIKQIYNPGAIVNIASDGYVFNDLLKVDNKILEEYKEDCLNFSSTMDSFRIYDIKDFFSKNNSIDTMREKLELSFGTTPEDLQEKILFDANTNILYRGMIRFMEEEVDIYNYPSNNQKHKAAKALTKQMMLRNETWSKFVSKEFESNIRLSMHPTVNNGDKYSFDLIKDSKYSPWHSVAVATLTSEYVTMHKIDAINAGYELNNNYFIKHD